MVCSREIRRQTQEEAVVGSGGITRWERGDRQERPGASITGITVETVGDGWLGRLVSSQQWPAAPRTGGGALSGDNRRRAALFVPTAPPEGRDEPRRPPIGTSFREARRRVQDGADIQRRRTRLREPQSPAADLLTPPSETGAEA